MKTIAKVALPILSVMLMAATCSNEQIVTLSLGFPTVARFIATGEVNFHDDSQIVNVTEDLDIEGALDDADIDINDLEDDAIKIVQVLYRVIQPDVVANRIITNTLVEVVPVDAGNNDIGSPAVLITGYTMPAGSGNVPNPEEWIDITNVIGTDGINLMNDYLLETVQGLKGNGPGPVNDSFRYHVRGTSAPPTETNFEWEVKLVFQGTVQKSFDVPFS
ncbi:MAG: hypothetical protein R3B81_12860 [bacterium]